MGAPRLLDQFGRPFLVENAGEKVSCRSEYDLWLWQEMGIRGMPIPYGAPNAAAHIERLIGTIRRECLDRMVICYVRKGRLAINLLCSQGGCLFSVESLACGLVSSFSV